MNKIVLLASVIIILIILTIIALVLTFSISKKEYEGDAIAQKETAIKIGRALLEEYFPDYFLGKEVPIVAEERNGIWRAFNDIPRSGVNEEGTNWVLVGGGVYVEFRKSTGEVIRFGLND